MATTYLAATRIKTKSDGPTGRANAEYLERGDKVTASSLAGGKSELEQLVADDIVVTEERFAQLFPEVVQGANQATGSPSNLGAVEGTELQANLPEEGDEVPTTRMPQGNPSDPPKVEGAAEST